jgi:hypothetical protein
MGESEKKPIRHFRDLDVYQNALETGLRVYALSKKFPHDEQYALTDQVRRSSRSVCANIAEAWRKRRYTARSPFRPFALDYSFGSLSSASFSSARVTSDSRAIPSFRSVC